MTDDKPETQPQFPPKGLPVLRDEPVVAPPPPELPPEPEPAPKLPQKVGCLIAPGG